MDTMLLGNRPTEVADLEYAINHCEWFLHYPDGVKLYRKILDRWIIENQPF